MTAFVTTVRGLRGAQKLFTDAAPIYISRAPGRLDVMGGNVDYTGGLVCEATIREATWAAAQRRTDQTILVVNPQVDALGWAQRVETANSQLSDAAKTRKFVNSDPRMRWTAYVLGVFHLLQNLWPEQTTSGMTIYLESDVPLNKGVSSSAAVEVATMKAAAAAYGIPLRGIELAEACQWVENVIAESACGIMDQATSVLGTEGNLLPLLCQPCHLEDPVGLPEELALWAIDSGVKHAVTGIEYEAARAAAFVGYRMICEAESLSITFEESGKIPRYVDPLWNGYLSNLSPSLFRSRYERSLPKRISGHDLLKEDKLHPDPFTQIREEASYPVRGCTRYAIEEQQRIVSFVELLRGLDQRPREAGFLLLGELMLQSHWSYTECGLGCEATDLLVELVREEIAPGQLYGAKISGGGAGGTVVVLGARDAFHRFQRVVTRYAELRKQDPYVFVGSSRGADEFGVLAVEANS